MTALVATSAQWLGLGWGWWQVLTGLAFAWFTWYHPRFWIPVDVRAIEADGSQQSLGSIFHRQRQTWRVLAALLAAGLAILPLRLGPAGFWAGTTAWVALLALHTGYWLWYFNPQLNLARRLDYVGKYHVSWAANASWLDRMVWREAWEETYLTEKSHLYDFVPGERDERVIPVAAQVYRRLLRECLLCGLILFFLLSLLTWFLLP